MLFAQTVQTALFELLPHHIINHQFMLAKSTRCQFLLNQSVNPTSSVGKQIFIYSNDFFLFPQMSNRSDAL